MPAELHRLADRCPLFEGVSARGRRRLVEEARVRTARAGDRLFRQGESSRSLLLVVDGVVKLVQRGGGESESILSVLGPGEVLGAVALLPDAVYPADAVAMGQARLLEWEGGALRRLQELEPRLARNALDLVSQRMRRVQEQLRQMATERVEQRLARALLHLADVCGRRQGDSVHLDVPLPRAELARMAATRLYSVSRILARWERAKMVQTGRERVTLLRPEALAALLDGDSPATEKASPDPSGTG